MNPLFHQEVVVVPLGSGSRGNATYIGDEKHGVLVDCGLSTRQILRRMAAAGLADAPLDAVLITHEHSDHVGSCAILDRKTRSQRERPLPFYMTPGTADGLNAKVRPSVVQVFNPGATLRIGSLTVETMSIAHDTRDPVCFTVAAGTTRVGVVTDLGSSSRLLAQQISTLDVLVLEFNHDVEMLMEGDYPWRLKQRIRSQHGHLSNEQAAYLLTQATAHSRRLKHLYLAHLSEENNSPAKALYSCDEALASIDRHDIKVQVCEQERPAVPVRIRTPLSYDKVSPSRAKPRITKIERGVPVESGQVSLFPVAVEA
jgi:phosphoribosyl 1,2-cyclic phosphodiesterase